MLTFAEKLAIIESFPELERKNVSLGRVNFQLKNSLSDKKNIVYHLHPNGNGYVFSGQLLGYEQDDKGMTNIRDFSAEELKKIIAEAIQSLTVVKQPPIAEQAIIGDQQEERWVNKAKDQLLLIYENEAWNIYFGLNLDATFDTYGEAEEFLREEGFHRV
ncbi:hypothetical protein [Bacillus sp. EB600]|uniref:hypothetical protein n=1 Tax=Bacillus sp. EB600 TaxID=2806345 RepID=UPI00210E89C2|nr:hypothetical protein [Bacillus sp. EB600]MCQ6277704.1 hypothetical protein [Bacillus sp. EB600]